MQEVSLRFPPLSRATLNFWANGTTPTPFCGSMFFVEVEGGHEDGMTSSQIDSASHTSLNFGVGRS